MLNVIANLSNDNICIGIVYIEDEPVAENDICLGVLEEVTNPISYIGKQYDKKTGKWTIPVYEYYAHIKNDIVINVVECLKINKRYQEDMVLLVDVTTIQDAETYIGKRYDKDKNMFVEVVPEPTQLDRIETAINQKNEEIAQNAVDKYTEELLEQGVL